MTWPRRNRLFFGIAALGLLTITAGAVHFMNSDETVRSQAQADQTDDASSNVGERDENPFERKQLVGDGKVTTDQPKQGYVYSCTSNFPGGGASRAGAWIDGEYWDPTKKIHVQGDVDWPNAAISIYVDGANRVVSSNDLPDHHTGIFPISPSDPAYEIDRNPNSIAEQEVLYSLPVTPSMASSPGCTSLGPVGVMTNGVLLYNALDAAGNDAAAHEVQDKCEGHPQGQDAYHYHSYSSCFESMSASDVIGYALDGYGITGPLKDDGTYYSTDDLDECHGTTSVINWDGQETSMYHYVMTADYPYSIGCFKGTSVQTGPGGQRIGP